MRVTRGYHDLGLQLHAPAVTIGNFDGVHLGHQAVIGAALAAAAGRGGDAVVCTFDPHTAHVLRPTAAPPLLQTLEQRLRAIESLGVTHCVVIPFDREIAATGHRHFVDAFLRRELHVQSLHVSKGFSFGRDRAGSTAYLERRAKQCGFGVERVPAVLIAGEPVSSTRVRQLVAAGEVVEAARLLGRPYAVVGRVVAGAGRGRGIGVPTANLEPLNGCLPGRGVYVTEARLKGEEFAAISNVGVRPTFEPEATGLVIETHLLEGSEPLAGADIEIAFLERLRDERRFESATALAAQIGVDIGLAREAHGRRATTARR